MIKRRKKTISVLAFFLLVAGYVYFCHFFFYYRIHQGGLPDVETKHTYMINDDNSKDGAVYASLGDSLTAGAGTEKYEDSYPYVLATKLSQGKPMALKNFSYPGARTDDLIKNLLSPAIESSPDIVTLLIGTNDMHGYTTDAAFRDNYEYILKRLTTETKAEVYVISVPFIGATSMMLPGYSDYFDHKTLQYNKIIKELASKYRVDYIDIASPTRELLKKDGPHYSRDSFHPSAVGYQQWAQIIYAYINK